MKSYLLPVLFSFVITFASPGAKAVIIVNNDEWTLSDTGFANVPVDTSLFATNLANFFAGGGTGTFHAYTSNFGFTGSSLASTLSGAGYTYTTGTGFAFTPANISGFDAVFLGGYYLNAGEIATLIDYVNSGGNVYLAGGTGIGGAAAEAAAWNPFLNAFGLTFGSSYNGIVGNVDVTAATHPIFNGVSMLYQNNGNSLSGPGIEVSSNGQGLYAVVSAVPVPAAFWLFGSGLLGMATIWRRENT